MERIHSRVRRGTPRTLSRRAVLGGMFGLAAIPLLQACDDPVREQAESTLVPQSAKELVPTVADPPFAPTGTPMPALRPAEDGTDALFDGPSPTPRLGGSPTPAASPPAVTAPRDLSGTVSIVAPWSGPEEASFRAVLRPFEAETQATVRYTGTRDLDAVLLQGAASGDAPELAALPSPGLMAELARTDTLVKLAQVIEAPTLQDAYPAEWLKLGQVGDEMYGLPFKSALKGLVWFDPDAFNTRNYQVPTTWSELVELSTRIAETDIPPWSIALKSGAASGWPGTDWIEDIVLRQHGPEFYERWARGDVPWTAPEIRQSWERWGTIVARPERMVMGGRTGMISTEHDVGMLPLYAQPPGAYMFHSGSFTQTFLNAAVPGLLPTDDYTFVPLPGEKVNETGTIKPMLAGGDFVVVLKDTPVARHLAQYLATPQAQAIWVERGGLISPTTRIDPAVYPDTVSKTAATLLSTSTMHFDASDRMAPAVREAFREATLTYVGIPDTLNELLGNLERLRGGSAP